MKLKPYLKLFYPFENFFSNVTENLSCSVFAGKLKIRFLIHKRIIISIFIIFIFYYT